MTGVDLRSTMREAHDLRAEVRDEAETEYLRLRTVDRPALLDSLARIPSDDSAGAAVIEEELTLLDRRIAAIRTYLDTVRGPDGGCRPAIDYCAQIDLGDGPQWILLTDLPMIDDRVVVADSPFGKALLTTAVGNPFAYRTPHGSRTGVLLALEAGPLFDPSPLADPLPTPDRRLVELERPRALELLGRQSPGVGRLAFNLFGIPHIEVVNFLLDDGDVIFRIDPGSKLIAVLHGAHFALQVDDIDRSSGSGWTVTVSGPARRVTGAAAEELLDRLTPWAPGERRFVIRMQPRAVFGRALVPSGTQRPAA